MIIVEVDTPARSWWSQLLKWLIPIIGKELLLTSLIFLSLPLSSSAHHFQLDRFSNIFQITIWDLGFVDQYECTGERPSLYIYWKCGWNSFGSECVSRSICDHMYLLNKTKLIHVQQVWSESSRMKLKILNCKCERHGHLWMLMSIF